MPCSLYTLDHAGPKNCAGAVQTGSHYSYITTPVLLSWLILSRHAAHTQLLQSRMAMAGRQLLLSFAEACCGVCILMSRC